ncbi:MAG: 4a-hydroxytetrahydrobiopterin dehydratase [Armatimonadetes bacterium]|nr:4a-hydroxytetrahydrobiopterin dehydratase [Armatimonadota bacterium]
MNLADAKCAACEGLEPKLSAQEIENNLRQTQGWELKANATIERTFKFINFANAMEFAKGIARIAEEENHHPELHVSWGKVRVELTTHSLGGLSTNDFIVAAKINRLWDQTERDT